MLEVKGSHMGRPRLMIVSSHTLDFLMQRRREVDFMLR